MYAARTMCVDKGEILREVTGRSKGIEIPGLF
jgi:hypothetical protein